ncbi:hypothetical protein BDZ91DRAFT_672059 [Kalaharituber pfeilii]|nr:hypothetical protein BDZ91DRAFT_672059 [Kalaharituber pfeilii]
MPDSRYQSPYSHQPEYGYRTSAPHGNITQQQPSPPPPPPMAPGMTYTSPPSPTSSRSGSRSSSASRSASPSLPALPHRAVSPPSASRSPSPTSHHPHFSSSASSTIHIHPHSYPTITSTTTSTASTNNHHSGNVAPEYSSQSDSDSDRTESDRAPTDSEETEEEEYPHVLKPTLPLAPQQSNPATTTTATASSRGVVKAKKSKKTAVTGVTGSRKQRDGSARLSVTPSVGTPRESGPFVASTTTAGRKRGGGTAGKAPRKKAGTSKPSKKKRRVDAEEMDVGDEAMGDSIYHHYTTSPSSPADTHPLAASSNQSYTIYTTADQLPDSTTITLTTTPPAIPYDPSQPVYCICRRPDSGKWMIGCDGCDDWFHGTCINIAESDGELVESYFCPNCTSLGRGVTSWKRKCRLPSCRKPAAVGNRGNGVVSGGDPPSKYCSQDHGIEFFEMQLLRSALGKNVVKSLVDGADDADSFRRLGERIATPMVEEREVEKAIEGLKELGIDCEALGEEAHLYRDVRPMLRLRMKYIDYVWQRRARIIDTLLSSAVESGEVSREICGYDRRLGWGEGEFEEWVTGIADANGASEGEILGVCMKRKCGKHQYWQKVRYEEWQLEVRLWEEKVQKLKGEEGRIWERVKRRRWRDLEGSREGRVVKE